MVHLKRFYSPFSSFIPPTRSFNFLLYNIYFRFVRMSFKDIKIHSIAACCNNWGIGNKGTIPWHLKTEFKHFSKVTRGSPPEGKRNVVIMGRKTWNSIPEASRPLKNRYNVVISRTLSNAVIDGPDAVVSSIGDLIDLLTSNEWKHKINDVFNIGGFSIYKALNDSPYCGFIYLTRVLADFECDTFFPPLGNDFTLVPLDKFPEIPQDIQVEKGIEWKVEVYEKTKSA